MKFTNNYNLPEVFMQFLRNEKYSKGDSDISVTSLIDSPRIARLRSLHSKQMTVDVSERIPALFGTAVHMVLQGFDDPNFIVEERLYAKMYGWTLSGAIDVQEFLPDGTIRIQDYKVCSVWAVMNDKPEWERQLNCYAYLSRVNKERIVSSVQIVAILKDWSARKAQRESDYPQSNAVVVDVPLWSFGEQQEYLERRVIAHQDAQVDFITPDISCSDEERWAKPSTWAVMKKGRKTAVKIFDDQRHADLFIKNHTSPNGLYVEHRIGEDTRCKENFCGVAEFCDQYKSNTTRGD